MKISEIVFWSAAIICLLTELSQGAIYETLGRSLASSVNGGLGSTSSVLQRSNDNQWRRGNEYERYSDSYSSRNQNSQSSNSNQGSGSFSMNRNNGGRDNNRDVRTGEERPRWE